MNLSLSRISVLLFLILILLRLIFFGSALGQTVGASIRGTITDTRGAVIANAKVEARNVGTGAANIATTDAAGRYRLPLLASGEYEVRVSATGFQPRLQRGVNLTVGQDVIVDATLNVGQIESAVTVEATGPVINTSSAALSGLVTKDEVRDLPLNGRSFQQLALLQTGVSAALAAGNEHIGGRTPKISINGARPEQNSFLLDGTDINNVYHKTPGSVAGVLLGVEAVLEFQVLTNAYSAEFGRSSGGVINAVTRSGSNDYHGSLFEFHRNSALDAKNFFDPADRPIPAFKRNQFGGALGGPIRQDKTFFFAAFEGLIERLGVTGLTAVPDDNARKGLLQASVNGNPQFNPDGTPLFRQIELHPAIPAYLDLLFPRVNGRLLKSQRELLTGAGEYFFTVSQPTDEYFVQGRIDHPTLN
jgi:Carboxypeptidase regulatory-like domain/TonB-dependent Receptor Plug Domain